MSDALITTLLRKAALCLAMALTLFAANASAEPTTYYFWTQSAYTYIESGGDYVQTPLTGSDLNLARSTLADSLQVTLLGTQGHLHYNYIYDFYLSLDQSNLVVDGDPSQWGFETLNPPVCGMFACELSAALQVDSEGLSGGIDIVHLDFVVGYLSLSGTGADWSGLWGKDPYVWNDPTQTIFVDGRWREVPIPATLALIALGLTGLGLSRRRKQ